METFHYVYAYLSKGGPVMAVLFLCSVACVALIFERFRALRKNKILPVRFLTDVESLVREKKVSEALALCRASDVPVGRILTTGLSFDGTDPKEMEEEMESAGRRETSVLERNLDFLGTLAAAGPLIGLLGTVTGMIRTFGVVAVTGVGDPLKLSGGIAEALLNTAGGLVVGIPALIAQQYFLHRVDRFVLEMEEYASRIVKMVRRRG
ncbi:MAG TPA: MotA/TolQ/ExbB proton channel family protein [Bdellovibrionota bacterium]|nr:MotA/TolQ/ExbB proton channel family protein [Bdellovibrionota bacterium]